MTSDSQSEIGGVVSSTEWLACPWCKDTDFDAVGLKLHIMNGHCEVFNELSVALPVTRQANVQAVPAAAGGSESTQKPCPPLGTSA